MKCLEVKILKYQSLILPKNPLPRQELLSFLFIGTSHKKITFIFPYILYVYNYVEMFSQRIILVNLMNNYLQNYKLRKLVYLILQFNFYENYIPYCFDT